MRKWGLCGRMRGAENPPSSGTRAWPQPYSSIQYACSYGLREWHVHRCPRGRDGRESERWCWVSTLAPTESPTFRALWKPLSSPRLLPLHHPPTHVHERKRSLISPLPAFAGSECYQVRGGATAPSTKCVCSYFPPEESPLAQSPRAPRGTEGVSLAPLPCPHLLPL